MNYFTPLTKVSKKLKTTHKKWKALAKEWDYKGPVAWQVRAGFTLKEHAPLFGPCWNDFKYLQNWNFPDEPTKDCIVFWIPRLVPESTNKTWSEQQQLVSDLGKKTKLDMAIGDVTLLSGLILTNYHETQEQVPFNEDWIRTETCRADGDRLDLRWREGQLYCDDWGWGEGRRGGIGVFALGVALGNSDTRHSTGPSAPSATRFACPHCKKELQVIPSPSDERDV